MEKKYQIIYADPPWRYGGRGETSKWRENLENLYPTMSDEELKNLDIQKLSEKDCLLFMWVVSPHLKECVAVGESWGFKYITIGFVWHKKAARLGNYTMSGCEICLIFKKGKIPNDKIKGKGNGVKQFLEQSVEKHSKKPNEIRNRINKMFPISTKIELFAREKTEGWDVWGNEVESDIKL